MKKTIVVVDDEEDILGLIEKILSSNSYSVLLAKNGKELFELLSRIKPDLIVLDVMMPGKDGYAICGHLKQKLETKDIPIMMLTVLADSSHVEKGKKMGAAAYLTKPFEPRELERQIKKILSE
ncbi:response regulator [bacterium]|nr:response regulator [bacterium]